MDKHPTWNSIFRIAVVSKNSCAMPYLDYPTQDRKATRVGLLHQIRLPRMRLSLVSYLEYPIRNSHALLSIACYSEPHSGQKPYAGRRNTTVF